MIGVVVMTVLTLTRSIKLVTFFVSPIRNKIFNGLGLRRLSSSMSSEKKIGTHNGVFHCDEVLACYMLKKLPQYKDATIVR